MLVEFILALFALVLLVIVFSMPFLILAFFIFSPLRERLVYWRYLFFPHYHNPDVIRALMAHFPYYLRLDRENRRRFETRLLIFMNSKKFLGRNGLVITERMKTLISASAIQLTFGLSYFRLNYFYRIFIYPDVYTYRHYKIPFRGHVSDSGSIHFSWNNFEKGYLFPGDGVNLGLHEMMHALKLYALQHHVDFTFYDNNETIGKLARIEMQKIKTRNVLFLKNRLINNTDELLAVSAECFFELPEQFNRELPELYGMMKKLLNQDPLRPQNPVLGRYSENAFLFSLFGDGYMRG